MFKDPALEKRVWMLEIKQQYPDSETFYKEWDRAIQSEILPSPTLLRLIPIGEALFYFPREDKE